MMRSAPRQAVISGGLLRMFGLGVLIIGDSGIGKSESALELIARGHRFVSDDVVHVSLSRVGRVTGRAPSLSRYFMELRGLGIINIREIFGRQAICLQSPIDLVIRLKKWHRKKEFDRLGLRFPEDSLILGKPVPQLNIPVAPGRNIATLIEVACKVHLCRKRGDLAAREISRRLDRAIAEGR
jgi:HPr kinase/phosphorylase